MAQTAAELQRSRGELRVRLRQLGERTVLADLYQQGCLKARLPQHSSRAPLEVVTINTAGGLTDGDEVASTIHWDSGSRGVVCTQAAERIYHCRQAPATITTSLDVADDAVAAWLPQETILFDHSHLERQTQIELGNNAVLFAVESLVFGRVAMQEIVRTGRLFDRLEIRQAGKLLLADALSLGAAPSDGPYDDIEQQLQNKSVLAGAKCCASLVFAGNREPALLDSLRALIAASPVSGGASDLGPVITMRLIAADSRPLRSLILQLYLACLGPFRFAEPRVWFC